MTLDELAAIPDAMDRARAAGEAIHQSRADVVVMAAIRREAVQELTRTMKQADVARALGVTQNRISSMLGLEVRKRAARAARAAARARVTPESGA